MASQLIFDLPEERRHLKTYAIFSYPLRTSLIQRSRVIFNLLLWTGRNHAFTAAYGAGNEEHEIRRMSTKEYYANTGSKRRNQTLQQEKREKGFTETEQNIPTPKTAKLDQFEHYIAYILQHWDALTDFYDSSRGEMAFRNYQGVQRSREEMLSIFVHGGKKYNKTRRKRTRKNRKARKRSRQARKKREEKQKTTMRYSVRFLMSAQSYTTVYVGSLLCGRR